MTKKELEDSIADVFDEMNRRKYAYDAVKNPEGNPKFNGWFEKNDKDYVPTNDEEVQKSKVYYIAKGIFEKVSNPSGSPKENRYYEYYNGEYYLSEDDSVVPGKIYYVPFNGDKFMREGIIQCAEDYIESLSLSTTVLVGSVGPNVFTQTKISWKTDLSPAYDYAVDVIKKCTDGMNKNSNSDFAKCLSDAVKVLASFSDENLSGKFPVNFTVNGTLTTPVGVTSPVSGPADGKVSGSFEVIYATLNSLFLAQLASPSSATDRKNASNLATAIDTCVKALIVTATGKSSIQGTMGTGKFM